MADENGHFVWTNGTYIPVTPEVYQACNQTKRYAKTLYEKDARHNLVSYDGMDTADTLGAEMIADLDAPSVEDIVLDRMRLEKLRLCLPKLTEEERALIYALFYEEKTEREYAEILGISQKAVSKRLHKILGKLHKLMEN